MLPLHLLISPLLFSTWVQGTRLVVSGYDSSLTVYTVLEASPWLEKVGDWPVQVDSPTWLQLDQQGGKNTIYGAHEIGSYNGVDGGVLSRWEVADGSLELIDQVNLPSPYPAHLLVVPEHGLAYLANYGGNSFTALGVDSEGQIGAVVHQEVFDEGCRDASHPHQTVTRGDWVWVVDLGCDSIRHYKSVGTPDRPELQRLGITKVREGAGPRHMVVVGERGLVVLVAELQSLVELYRLDESDGSLELLQQLDLSSDAGDFGAEVLLGPQGNFVYASSRGTGVVVVYKLSVLEDSLERVQEFNLGGTWPRHMAFRGQMLVVADQKGDSLQVMMADPETGLLTGWDMVFDTCSQPSFVGFLE